MNLGPQMTASEPRTDSLPMKRFTLVCWICWALLARELATAEEWTLAILGDTQEYVNGPDTPAGAQLAAGFTAQAQWIVDQAASENIVFVSQNGDIVSEGNVPLQWQRADAAMSLLDGLPSLPWSTNAGNHELNVPDDLTSGYSEYLRLFGPHRHEGQPWFGGSDAGVDNGLGLNTYQVFAAGERDYLHLSLEYDIPDPAVDWATSILAAHPACQP